MVQVLTRIVLAVSVMLLTTGAVWAGDKGKTRILFIGCDPDHTYGTHMYMHTSAMLARCAELTSGVQGIVSNGWPKDPKMAEGVKSIVVYTRPGGDMLLDGPQREQVEALMKKGAGLVTIHWGTSISKRNLEKLGPLWFTFTGGAWLGPGTTTGKTQLKQLLPDHPLCRGWKDFEFEEEVYLNPTLKGAKPALQVRDAKGKDVIVGWVYDRPDGGRSFGTTLGHFYKNFQNDSFRRMIVNGILWSAHIDVPAQGAPINVAAEVLALPPKK